MNIIDTIESENLRKDEIAPFNIGDTVKVFVKIKEGDKIYEKYKRLFKGVKS